MVSAAKRQRQMAGQEEWKKCKLVGAVAVVRLVFGVVNK